MKNEQKLLELNASLEARLTERTAELDAAKEELLRQIAGRQRAEQALRTSEERFRSYFELGLIGMSITSPDKSCVEVNDELCRILGYERSEMLRMNWAELTHPDDLANDVDHFNRVLAGEIDGYSIEKRFIRKDGQVIDATISVKCLRRADGSVVYLMALLQDITERKKAEQQIARFAELFQALSHRLLDVQEEERRHLARELHDEIGQALTAAKLNLKIVAPNVPMAIADRVEDSVQLLDRLLAQVRQLSLDLRPPLLDDLGLVPALRWLADHQSQRAQVPVAFTANVEGLEMDPPLRTACFRVAQEAITNAIRHARAATVAVELRAEPERVWLVVNDDGVGFDKEAMQQRAARGASIGLLSMNERVSLLGGELEVDSAPRKGTIIRAWFPRASPGPGPMAQNA